MPIPRAPGHPSLPVLPAQPPVPAIDPDGLPTVRALAALWQRVAARPLWAPSRFWRYLRLRRRMRLALLDPHAMVLVAPAGKVNDCSACTDLCCVGPRSTVLLRLRDIAMLVDTGRTHLMTHDKPRFSAEEMARRPALRRQLASSDWRRFPVLRQRRDGTCAALTTRGRCSLYPAWPRSCARFPYALQLEAQQIVYAPRCQAFFIHPNRKAAATAMQLAAVAAYNDRIKDAVLLAFAPKPLEELGLLHYLQH